MLLENLRIGVRKYSDLYEDHVRYRRIDYNTGEIYLYPFWHKPIWVLMTTIENILKYYLKKEYISCKLTNYIHKKLL